MPKHQSSRTELVQTWSLRKCYKVGFYNSGWPNFNFHRANCFFESGRARLHNRDPASFTKCGRENTFLNFRGHRANFPNNGWTTFINCGRANGFRNFWANLVNYPCRSRYQFFTNLGQGKVFPTSYLPIMEESSEQMNQQAPVSAQCLLFNDSVFFLCFGGKSTIVHHMILVFLFY